MAQSSCRQTGAFAKEISQHMGTVTALGQSGVTLHGEGDCVRRPVYFPQAVYLPYPHLTRLN